MSRVRPSRCRLHCGGRTGEPSAGDSRYSQASSRIAGNSSTSTLPQRSPAKGGSTNAISNDDGGCMASQPSASAWTTLAASPPSILPATPRNADASTGSDSTSVACAAPRDNASNPSAPLPANRSRTREPGSIGCNQLNRVSRTRSGVGRKPGRSSTGSRVPRHRPPMIRTLPGNGLRVCFIGGAWRRVLA